MKRTPKMGDIIKITGQKGPLVVVGQFDHMFNTILLDHLGTKVKSAKANPTLTLWGLTNIAVKTKLYTLADISLMGHIKLKKNTTITFHEK